MRDRSCLPQRSPASGITWTQPVTMTVGSLRDKKWKPDSGVAFHTEILPAFGTFLHNPHIIDEPGTESGGDDAAGDWQVSVLDILRSMKPDAFERLCQRILRESGFAKVEVTGRVGDGGIDGAGVLRVNLISFRVLFQCKRYSGSVGAPEIRKFQGAVVGRADKGLFITTGRFTKDAEREAVRDGAPAIDLIPGNELCDLLKSLELGVSTQTVEVVKPIPAFFSRI